MAVEDKYVDSELAAGKLAKAAHNAGADLVCMVASFEVAAADDDGSVYRLFKDLPGTLIPVQIEIMNDAITGATDYELGLYEPGIGGAAKDIDCLLGSTNIASGNARSSKLDGLGAVAIEDSQQTLMELAGDTLDTTPGSYDLAITANTVGSAAGTITVTAWFIQG